MRSPELTIRKGREDFVYYNSPAPRRATAGGSRGREERNTEKKGKTNFWKWSLSGRSRGILRKKNYGPKELMKPTPDRGAQR